MSDQIPASDPVPSPAMSRRESIRLAAIATLGAGLGGVTGRLEASAGQVGSQAGYICCKYASLTFWKIPTDGGQLVGTVPLSPELTSFLTTDAGSRTIIKLVGDAQVLGSMTLSPEITANLRKARAIR